MADGKRRPIQISSMHHRLLRLIQRRMEDTAGSPGEYNPKFALINIMEAMIEDKAKKLNIVTDT